LVRACVEDKTSAALLLFGTNGQGAVAAGALQSAALTNATFDSGCLLDDPSTVHDEELEGSER